MANDTDDVLFLGGELEIIAAKTPSGRMGIEVFKSHASNPQEPEAVRMVRDVLTKFLVDNGYE